MKNFVVGGESRRSKHRHESFWQLLRALQLLPVVLQVVIVRAVSALQIVIVKAVSATVVGMGFGYVPNAVL